MMQGDDLFSRKRRRKNKVAHMLFAASALVSILILIVLLYDLIRRGAPYLTATFFQNFPSLST